MIAFAGKNGAGKSTCADIVCEYIDCQIIKFAAPLYSINNKYYNVLSTRTPGKNRKLLQTTADIAKEEFGDDVFVDAFKESYNKRTKMVIVDDLRFDNEAVFIKSQGGIIINIVNNRVNEDSHCSNLGLSNYFVKYTINNNNDLESLRQQILYILYMEFPEKMSPPIYINIYS